MTGPFLAVAAASLLFFIADGLTLPIYPVFVTGPLGGDAAALGLVFGALQRDRPPAAADLGVFADRRGRRPLLIGGAVLLAVSMLGHIVASTVELLIVMRLLLGAAEAAFFVAAFTMAAI